MNERRAVGVYLHVPFCLSKCPYCDFYSVPFREELAEAYAAAVLRALAARPGGRFSADTVYFGGGTPGLLGAGRIGRILAALPLAGDAEVTMELNPSDVESGELWELRAAGVNRLSIGVQSLDRGELRSLGRRHGPEEARRAVCRAAEAGFENLSADLMLAIPGQTPESLAASAKGLAGLPLRHISAYLLKIEEGTVFYQKKDALSLPDEDETAAFYLEAVRILQGYGFRQYEISNFAKENSVSRHNLKYWRCEEYLGVGPAAHSFFEGRRFCFPPDLEGFLRQADPFSLVLDAEPGGGPLEQAMLRLRLAEGLRPSELEIAPARAQAMLAKAGELAAHGLIRVEGDRAALTAAGFLLSNSVIGALLDAAGLLA